MATRYVQGGNMKGQIENGKQKFYRRVILERYMTDEELETFQRRYDDAKKLAIADKELTREGLSNAVR